MTAETISLLISPALAVAASLVLFWLARREAKKTTALVAQMKEHLSVQLEEQARRVRLLSTETSGLLVPNDVKEQAAHFIRGALRDSHR